MTCKVKITALAVLAAGCLFSNARAQYSATLRHPTERPTLNPYTGDPRPDILPYYIHHRLPEYRRVYNRPRFWTGMIAHTIAPTSQEAMSWCENLHEGVYREKHAPPRYKRYFGPKPWEVLQTGARPDFADRDQLLPDNMQSQGTGSESVNSDEPVPMYEDGTEAAEEVQVPDPNGSSRREPARLPYNQHTVLQRP